MATCSSVYNSKLICYLISSAFACYTPAARDGVHSKKDAIGAGPAHSTDEKTHEVSNE